VQHVSMVSWTPAHPCDAGGVKTLSQLGHGDVGVRSRTPWSGERGLARSVECQSVTTTVAVVGASGS
jgi:hypothetical protein